MKGLQGSTGVVTGGSNGIGRATVESLVSYGSHVTVLDIDEEAFQELKAGIPNSVSVSFLRCDISQETSLDAAIAALKYRFDRIDYLVNCASGSCFKSRGLQFADWSFTMERSVASYCYLTEGLLELLKGHGSIVNMASISGLVAQEDLVAYGASKAAIISLSRSHARCFAPFGVRVNSVSPGTVWTDSNAYYIGRDHGLTRAGADQSLRYGGHTMLRRVACPQEIAEPICFLCSASSSYVTGQNLVIDGGYTSV